MDYQMHHRVMFWMEEAAAQLRDSLSRSLFIEEKNDPSDLVTEMDRKIEKYFVERINHYYPDHAILGEEGQAGDGEIDNQGHLWIIDPIDGTLNFVKAKNHFGIMIGIYFQNQPLAGYIYDVMNEDLYFGIVGEGVYMNYRKLEPQTINQLSESLIIGNVATFVNNRYNMQELLDCSLGARSYGASALEIIAVIRGEAALYFSNGIQPWDFAAGLAICTALGYPVTDVEGNPLNILKKSTVLFAAPHLHAQALKILNSK